MIGPCFLPTVTVFVTVPRIPAQKILVEVPISGMRVAHLVRFRCLSQIIQIIV
jgi:hypothetical protein